VRRVLALLLLVAAAPTSASAQPPQTRAISGPWADSLVPGHRTARRHVRQGLAFLLQALQGHQLEFEDRPYLNIERALLRFERARAVMPDDVDLAYYTAVALTNYEAPATEGGIRRRVHEAIDAWERVRALDAEHLPAQVAFHLASLHARRAGEAARERDAAGQRRALERVTAEYQRALDRDVPEATFLMGRSYNPTRSEVELAEMYMSIPRSTVHGNLAENLMLVGRLEESITHYRQGLELSRSSFGRALMQWGLGLALHRAGDAQGGLTAALEAVQSDPLATDPEVHALQRRWGAFTVLHHPGVFFEPAYEIHAYHAVGYEGFAAHPGVDAPIALRRALTSWRRFLAEGGTASRYAEHARAQVERLEARLADADEADGGAAPPRARSPRRLRDTNESSEVWLPLDG